MNKDTRDCLDWRIIDVLRTNGRATNKKIAAEVGLSEPSVAARIKSLREDKVMLVTLQRDIYSQGYDFQCAVDVYVKPRRTAAVARKISAIDEVMAVNVMIGRPELILLCNAADRNAMNELIYRRIAGVRGIERLSVLTTLEIHKYESGFGDLSG